MSLRLPSFAEILAVSRSHGKRSEAPHLWDGLAGAWPLQEGGGSTARDVSGYGNHGTNNGATSVVSELGRAMSFTANNIDIGAMDSVENISGIAISAWIRPSSLIVFGGIFSKLSSATNDISLILWTPATALGCLVRNGANSYGYTASGLIAANKWHHVAMVFNGANTGSDKLACYVNGSAVPMTYSGTLPSVTPSSDVNAIIGQYATYNFAGQISNYLIYKTNLPPSEIQQLYADPWAMYRLRRTVVGWTGAVPSPATTRARIIGGGVL